MKNKIYIIVSILIIVGMVASLFSLLGGSISVNNAKGELPASFNLEEETEIELSFESQGNSNLCWTFSATRSFESNIIRVQNIREEFNPVHAAYGYKYLYSSYLNSQDPPQTISNEEANVGGDFYQVLHYWTSQYGPVKKSDSSQFTLNKILSSGSIQSNAILDTASTQNYNVESTFAISGKHYERKMDYINAIKQAIYDYGAVIFNGCKPSLNQKEGYENVKNDATGAIYCNNEESLTHAMIIIGWDDNYSTENFNSSNKPNNNGAFIVKNSYTINDSTSPYYYYSYDCHFFDITSNNGTVGALDSGRKVWGIKSVTTTDYDNTYGDIGKISYHNSLITDPIQESYIVDTIPSKVIYKDFLRKSDNGYYEELKKVMFYTAKSTNYNIYINKNKVFANDTFEGNYEEKGYELVASGRVEGEGLHSINIENAVKLVGNNFSIGIEFSESDVISISFPGGNDIKYWNEEKNQWVNRNASLVLFTNNDTFINAESVTLDKPKVTIDIGKTVTLTATVYPSNASDKTIYWKSSNEDVATVDSSGLVTGIATGTATITATTVNGKTATAIITVEQSLTGVEIGEIKWGIGNVLLGETLEIEINEERKLCPIFVPSATNKTLSTEFTSNDSDIVSTTFNGEITGVSVGTATITLTINVLETEEVFTDTIEITVQSPTILPTRVTLDKPSYSVDIGKTVTLIPTVSPGNASNKTIIWDSSNEGVATVDSSGVVTGIAAGEAKITATTEVNGITATATITVLTPETAVLEINESSGYQIEENYLKYINANSTIEQLKEEIENVETEYEIYESNGNTIAQDLVKTGQIIKIGEREYKISVLGDTTGDGKISFIDIMNIAYNIYTDTKLTNEYLLSADYDKDSNYAFTDLMKISQKLYKATI